MIDTAGGSTSAPAGDVEIPASPAPHIVHIAERCEGNPHPFDVVTLHEEPPIEMGIAVSAVMNYFKGDEIRIEAGMGLEFMRWGIKSWTFTTRVNGKTYDLPTGEPVDRDLIQRWLPFTNGGLEVVEAATALYKKLLDPFRQRYSTRLQAALDELSTSPTNGSGATHPKRSRRSSPRGSGGKRSGARAR